MSNRISRFLLALLAILVLFVVVFQWNKTSSPGHVILELVPGQAGVLLDEALEVEEPLRVVVSAVGSTRLPRLDSLAVTAWMVEQRSGKVVWSMGRTSLSDLRGTRVEARDTLLLEPGLYRVYFSTLGTVASDLSATLVQRLRKRETQWVNDRDSWRLTISALDQPPGFIGQDRGAWLDALQDSLLAQWNTRQAGNDQTLELYVAQQAPVRIRLLGVRDRASGLHLELLSLGHSGTTLRLNAGNLRMLPHTPLYGEVDTTVVLPQGVYRVTYRSGPGWDVHPPERAYLWGAVLLGASSEIGPPAYWTEIPPILEITRLAGNQVREEQFEVTDSAWVRIEALGEISDRTLMDYATLFDARDRVIWQQSRDGSEHAGGSPNNRRSVTWLNVPPGSYKLRFETDPRHHYEDFQSSRRPDHPDRWGVGLFALGDDQDRIVLYTATKPSDQELTRIVPPDRTPLFALLRVGNKQEREVSFTLPRPGRYLIVALGEIADQAAYDTGGLRRSNEGHVLWQLERARTVHAGGSLRNRIAQQELFLGAGTYTLYFQTDDSHAYGDFDNPPDFPEHWGIALYTID